jgi:electron-transferring-flavoprotein dehydrogenase
MATGAVQIWPASPVAEPLVDARSRGRRAARRPGHRPSGQPEADYVPGMDVRAALTVVGDGPVGAVGRALDDAVRSARGSSPHEWAIGMKVLVDLPTTSRSSRARCCTRSAIRSRRSSASSTSARRGSRRSASSCRRGSAAPCAPRTATCSTGCSTRTCGAPRGRHAALVGRQVAAGIGASAASRYLAGDGYARIGEGSGSTNVLTGSGVDEAWTTGRAARRGGDRTARGGRAVHGRQPRAHVRRTTPRELGRARRPRGRARARRVPQGGRARPARDGARRPHRAVVSPGRAMPAPPTRVCRRSNGTSRAASPRRPMWLKAESTAAGVPLHDAIMDRLGWPASPTTGGCSSRTRTRCCSAARCRPRPATPTTSSSATRWCASTAAAGVHRGMLGRGAQTGPRRRAGVRPGEVRALRRVPVELHRARRRSTHEPRLPRRPGGPALGGELVRISLALRMPGPVETTDTTRLTAREGSGGQRG